MRLLVRAIALAGIFALLLALAACPGKKAGTAGGGTASGTTTKTGGSPDFVSFEGEPIRLADYTGQPVVVTFWAVW